MRSGAGLTGAAAGVHRELAQHSCHRGRDCLFRRSRRRGYYFDHRVDGKALVRIEHEPLSLLTVAAELHEADERLVVQLIHERGDPSTNSFGLAVGGLLQLIRELKHVTDDSLVVRLVAPMSLDAACYGGGVRGGRGSLVRGEGSLC